LERGVAGFRIKPFSVGATLISRIHLRCRDLCGAPSGDLPSLTIIPVMPVLPVFAVVLSGPGTVDAGRNRQPIYLDDPLTLSHLSGRTGTGGER